MPPRQSLPTVSTNSSELAEKDLGPGRVGRGEFGTHMRVSLVNDGPFTVMLDSEELGL